MVAICLQWLADGSYIDIRHAYGCNMIASLYLCRNLFIDAVLYCKELKIIFPEEKEDFIKLAYYSFECNSSEGMIRGCVGRAIDGFLATINHPRLLSEGGNNPDSFFRSLHDLWNQSPGCL